MRQERLWLRARHGARAAAAHANETEKSAYHNDKDVTRQEQAAGGLKRDTQELHAADPAKKSNTGAKSKLLAPNMNSTQRYRDSDTQTRQRRARTTMIRTLLDRSRQQEGSNETHRSCTLLIQPKNQTHSGELNHFARNTQPLTHSHTEGLERCVDLE
jgi:hypothetical protein